MYMYISSTLEDPHFSSVENKFHLQNKKVKKIVTGLGAFCKQIHYLTQFSLIMWSCHGRLFHVLNSQPQSGSCPRPTGIPELSLYPSPNIIYIILSAALFMFILSENWAILF